MVAGKGGGGELDMDKRGVLFVGLEGIMIMIGCNPHEHNIHEGTYRVQSGHRNDIAIIDCPYIAHKV